MSDDELLADLRRVALLADPPLGVDEAAALLAEHRPADASPEWLTGYDDFTAAVLPHLPEETR